MKLKKYKVNFQILGQKKFCFVEAQSEYGAHIAFDKFIRERIVIDSLNEVEEEKPSDPTLESFKNIFGYK